MDDAIVAFQIPSLTALIHGETKRRKVVWEATCPELNITVRADEQDAARNLLTEAVQDFLETASDKEIESRLTKGSAYILEPLPLMSSVRAEEHRRLQFIPNGALAVVGNAKNKSVNLAGSVVDVAAHSGRFIAGTAMNAYTRTQQTLAQQTMPLLIGLTGHAGVATDAITKNSSLQQLAKTFNLEQWLNAGDQVNIEEAQQIVSKLRASYPDESNRQIARRLITQKAVYAGGVGLSTSLLPGAAIPLLALDMAATALLQAELIFQIAAAYGLDLKDPARKGEMLAVFGCVLGGSKAVKAGLGVLRNAPVAGAVIGATSNAMMIYALGNVACSFYEKRLDLDATAQVMEVVKQENALYLEAASNQQIIADQITMHVLRAGNPVASRDELLQRARELNFGPASVEVIKTNWDAPTSLKELLPLLNAEFGSYISGRARQIAEADLVVTGEEAEALNIITRYFSNAKMKIDLAKR